MQLAEQQPQETRTAPRRRWLLVWLALAVVAVGGAVKAQRSPGFYAPARLKAESQIYDHFFRYSKWFNRYYDNHAVFPAQAAEFAVAAHEQQGDAAGVRTDPWGTEYQVRYSPTWFTVRSAGPDRTFVTADDRVLEPRRAEAYRQAVLSAPADTVAP
ncbi:MAG TPA: hypothetical protein PKM88_02865 [bacterium]|nr:hypothetical protein [bacterium]